MINNAKGFVLVTILTMFSSVSYSAYNDMHKAVDENNIKLIENLLNTNATLLQELDDDGNTPLHKAILEDKNASLQSFMKFKRYINTQIRNQSGDTPLVYAIKNKKYNSIIFMLDNGINPFYRDSNQKNSLDYVRETGDVTTKQIYNEYYSRNRDKIMRLQESYDQPIDLSLFEQEEKESNKDEIKYKKPKPSTVQDLLIGNLKSKNLAKNENLVSVQQKTEVVKEKNIENSKAPIVEASQNKEAIQKISDKIESLNVDNQLVSDMEERIKLLEKENDYLKNKIDLRIATGKVELDPLEEKIARSPYAGIYEQQLVYGDITTNESGIPNFDDLKTIQTEEEMPIMGDILDYKTETIKTLNNIEQEFPAITSNIEKAIKTNVQPEKVVLPVSALPENQVVVNPTLDNINKEIEIVKKEEIISNDNKNTEEKKANLGDVNSNEKIKPTIKIMEAKTNFNEEFSKRITSDYTLAIILCCFSLGFVLFVVYGIISYKDYKKKKINVIENKVNKNNNVNNNLKVTEKDKI